MIFDQKDRELLQSVFSARRDTRGNRYMKRPIEPEILQKLLEAAISAPSVGYSQPWRFIIVKDLSKRNAIYREFMRENEKAKTLFKGNNLYSTLRLEGILESDLNIAVLYCKPKQTVLGQTTQKKMGEYSVVCAIQNLWLMARAYNIGVGWVSILRPAKVKKILGISTEYKLVSYLTLGYVTEFLDEPELLQIGWDNKKDLQEVVEWV